MIKSKIKVSNRNKIKFLSKYIDSTSKLSYFDMKYLKILINRHILSIKLSSALFYLINPKWTKYRTILSLLSTKTRATNHDHHLQKRHSNNQRSLNLFIFFITLFSCLTFGQSTISECHFPEQWWGSWFQKGVSNKIIINKYNISEKGICRKIIPEKDWYLIENRSDACVRCLVINARHDNILHYKETSYCYPLSQLSFDICNDINGDAPLYSLFRVNTPAIKCPFNGPFTFSYSKGLNECKDPLSTIDECTDDKHMLFKFRACADISGSESKIEQLECIADWKEGSYRYLVGRLYHQLANTDEDRFRCFVIEKNTTDLIESYNIAQSGEASCEGLFTPRDGARTFKLRKTQQIKPSCDFPSWLVDPIRWTTLDNRHIYDFSALKTFKVLDSKFDILRNAKCLRADDVSFSYPFNTSRFIIHTTVQCQSGFACMQAYQRDDRIVEIQIGNIVSDLSDACFNFNPRSINFTTLTTLDQETRPCELSGIYSIRTKLPGVNYRPIGNYSRMVSLLDSRFVCQEKALKLKSDCDEPYLFQFICTTDNRVKNFYCRGGWKENDTQYILVSLKDKFNYEYCVAYNTYHQEIRLIRNSHFCYRPPPELIQEQPWSVPFRLNNPNNRFPTRFDDSVSFILINDGSCQRSSSRSSQILQDPFSRCQILLITIIITLLLTKQISS